MPLFARSSSLPRKEILTFVAIGASNTLLSLAIYWLLLPWLTHTIAFAIACVAGTVYSGFANARMTFSSAVTVRSFSRFLLSMAALYAFNAVLLELLVRGIGIDARYAVLVVIATSLPLNFLASRVTLKAKSKDTGPRAPRATRR